MSRNETVSVSALGADLLLIEHSLTEADGDVSNDTLVIPRAAAGWLADHVTKVFEPDSQSPYEWKTAPDDLRVLSGGPEQEPCANIINRRAPGADRPGASAAMGVLQPAAHELAAKLRAI